MRGPLMRPACLCGWRNWPRTKIPGYQHSFLINPFNRLVSIWGNKMPTPKDWSDEDVKKRDERVTAMLADTGFHARRASETREERAYTIATAQIDKERKAE